MSRADGSTTSSGGAGRGSWLKTIGWGAYLACSWTWCIGMFLPVLLIRDYGVWGYIAFAAPNVVGAAAMGWVLRRPGHSEGMVKAHRAMVFGFSYITIAFQMYFFMWLAKTLPGGRLVPADNTLPLGLAAVAFFASVACLAHPRWRVFAGGIAWVFSVLAAFMLVQSPGPSAPPVTTPPAGLLWLAPTCVFGFALCPYLDVTFHEARRSAPRDRATMAFVIGFGFFFLCMILMTLGYSGYFADQPTPGEGLHAMGPRGGWLFGHLGLQLMFTVLAHMVVIRQAVRANTRLAIWTGLAGLAAMFIPLGAAAVDLAVIGPGGMRVGEIVYRLFMSFYGLMFPAYVWICMMPTWRSPARPTNRQVIVWLGACAVAGPMYWMGFIERVEWWLGPGLAVVLLARLAIGPVAAGRGQGDPGPDGLSGAPVPAPTRPPTLAAGATAES